MRYYILSNAAMQCIGQTIIMRLGLYCNIYDVTDFMHKDDDLDTAFIYIFAEFVCWTIRMLCDTNTQSVGEFAYVCPAGTVALRIRRLLG